MTNTKDPNHFKIKEYKASAIVDLTQYWFSFIVNLAIYFNKKLDFISSSLIQNQKEVISAITASKDQTINNIRTESAGAIKYQQKELALLKTQVKEQGDILHFLENQEIARKLAEKRSLQLAEQRRNRVRKPPRDAASLPELYAALNNINDRDYRSDFTRSRDRVPLIMLYFTGLRVSNLLLIT